MHGSFEKQPRDDQNTVSGLEHQARRFAHARGGRADRNGAQPSGGASKWISDAAQAEFVGTDIVPDLAPPTRIAQPTNEIRTVKAY